MFHLPIDEAAKQLEIGVTVLKKYCRTFHLSRWPFRKLSSLKKLMNSMEHTLQELDGMPEESSETRVGARTRCSVWEGPCT